MKIRPMADKDLEQVCEIEKKIFTTPWSYISFQNSISSKDNMYFVAEHEGEVVGYCGLWAMADEGQITNVAVKEKYRNKDIGYALVDTLIDYGKENGLVAFMLEVRKSNDIAIKLYQKLGFERLGVRKNYYSKPVEDALVMMYKNEGNG